MFVPYTIESCSVFCDFCEKMKRQVRSLNVNLKHSLVDNGKRDSCHCQEIQPGRYDIDTEICTPTLEELKDKIPPSLRNDLLENEGMVSQYQTCLFEF